MSKRDLTKIASRYGIVNQLQKTTEELAEAAASTIRYMQQPTSEHFTEMASEFADVLVLIDQLKIFMPALDDEIEYWKKAKVKRQIERIEAEGGHE